MPADDSGRAELSLAIEDAMARFGRAEWNALVGDGHPFMDWDFLEALEATGCAAPETGWTPQHLALRDADGLLVGAAALYVKDHSRGEFVFDWGWADALERAGGRYYPKLLCAAPFTPVTGPRLLAGDGARRAGVVRLLAGAIAKATESSGLSSAHVNFLREADWEALGADGWLQRTDQQYHWFNRGYETFDDFLSALASRKRKMIRKERIAANEGLEIVRLSGDDLKAEHWDAFFQFYVDTGDRKWGSPYLNREFFDLLHQRMRDKVVLVMALEDGTPIAGALNVAGRDALYGRYWGRRVERPFLHFEVCYYQAIEHAIEAGLDRVEAGAQGDHKLARGYEPVTTRSAHWIVHPGLHAALEDHLERERRAVADGVEQLAAYTPFRKGARSDAEHDEEGF